MDSLTLEEQIEELDWHTFDGFVCLGPLFKCEKIGGTLEKSGLLAKLGAITATLSVTAKHCPRRSLYIYVGLGLPATGGQEIISCQRLHTFYERFFLLPRLLL